MNDLPTRERLDELDNPQVLDQSLDLMIQELEQGRSRELAGDDGQA